ncbi:mucosal addressin cell adhesion molecule 1 [Sceloporus undulatus]|uniref:mucosal addressin cell adhesion molecule 1 n=1 Tax=Sceloporus undulatus TaxID=8520 RepID=UPI001C4D1826|nr:mucosal addressin cell adhesion molecule 1 [Sceloporus undulatus]
MALISFGILFSLVWCNCGLPAPTLTIHPKKPLVERGGSIQLNCSMDCPGGKVQWEGLDIELGNIISNHTYSILTVTNATINMEGMKFCTGQCKKRPYQNKAALQVYSFPDTLQLESQPQILTAGQPARLFCSISHVYPPGALTLSWFRGAEKLDAALEEEEEMEDSQEQLFLYRSILEVPTTEEGTAYRCRATLEVEEKTFSREKVANVTLQATQGAPIMTEQTTLTLETVRTSHLAPSVPSTTTDRISFVAATSGLPTLRFTKPHTTVAPTVLSKAIPSLESVSKTNSPGLKMVNRTVSHITTPVAETWRRSSEPEARVNSTLTLLHVTAAPAELGVSLTDQEFTISPASTDNSPLLTVATEKLHMFTTPEEDLCHPVIKLIPPQGTTGGALRISCHVTECRDSIEIKWVETPVSQAQYKLEEAEGQSTLMVESVGLEHQGLYQCIARTSQPRMASVRVVVSEDKFSTDALIAIGTAGSLLGLVITGYVSRRLWRQRGGYKCAAPSLSMLFGTLSGHP